MALPVIADIFRVTLNWNYAAGVFDAHNVLHISCPTGDESDVFTAIDAQVTQAMWDWVSGSAVVESVDVLALDGSSATHNHTVTGSKWTGGGLGTGLPQVAGLVKLQTGLRGPRHRGRVFLPFVGEGEVAGNTLIDVAAVTTAWDNFANALIANSPTMALGVASYAHADWNQATGIIGESKTATQRRRNDR